MLGIGLARRASDERRADRDIRNPFAQLIQQRLNFLTRDPAAHLREDLIIDVLQWHIDIRHHARAIRDGFDHLIRKTTRVGVHQTQPMHIRKFAIQRPEQTGQAGGVADIRAEAGGVLANEIQFNRAVGSQLFGFGEDLFDRFGTHQTTDARNRAERATLIASFANAQVCVMAGGQSQSAFVVLKDRQAIRLRFPERRIIACNQLAAGHQLSGKIVILAKVVTMFLARVFFAADGFYDMLAIEDTDEAVDSGFIGEQLGLVTLHETAGNDYALALAVLLHLNGIADFGHRFGLRRLQKATGIDDDGVSVGCVVRDCQPVHCEQPEHPLAVDEVLRTTETDESDSLNLFRTLGFNDRLDTGLFGHGKLRKRQEKQQTASDKVAI